LYLKPMELALIGAQESFPAMHARCSSAQAKLALTCSRITCTKTTRHPRSAPKSFDPRLLKLIPYIGEGLSMYACTAGQYLFPLYESLNIYFGDLHWWPGDSPFEVIVGAILTQNTTWHNVEIAIKKLKAKELLHPGRLMETEDDVLAELIRSSGYYNVKTRRLKSFVQYLCDEYDGSLDRMFAEDLWHLRETLLRVKGIGEETADSILLYAGEKPVFVVDAYTRRILQRHGFSCKDAGYGEIQALFMTNLPNNVPLYKQYHALLVNTGKTFCNKTPRCEGCPLGGFNACLNERSLAAV